MIGRTRVLGASLVAVALSVGVAEAKTVRYEINGQRYSYDTGNREQVALARQRINAANAEAAARAKAESERAANPLVRVLGSTTQAEAKAAESQLKEVLSKRPVDSAKVRKQPVVSTLRPATNDAAGKFAAAKAPTALVAENRTRAMVAGDAKERPEGTRASTEIETITFDFASGIRTVKRADGSIEEDLFDASSAAALKARASGGSATTVPTNSRQGPLRESQVATKQP